MSHVKREQDDLATFIAVPADGDGAEAELDPNDDDGVRTPVRDRNADGETFFDLGASKRITLRSFKGKPLVDIREFYQKDGQVLPGKRGCSLSPEQWLALKSGPTAALLAEDGRTAPGLEVAQDTGERFFKLGGLKRVTLREAKGREVVDVREFYMKDGAEAPGMKGLTLDLDQWAALLRAPVDPAALPPPPPAAAGPSTAAAPGTKGKSKAAAAVAAPPAPGPAPAAAAAAGKKRKLSAAEEDALGGGVLEHEFESGPEGEKFVRLGSNKRLTVRSFKGKPLVDVREYYTKDGEELPGKKGISLTPEQGRKEQVLTRFAEEEQWAAVRASAGAVDRLLAGASGGGGGK